MTTPILSNGASAPTECENAPGRSTPLWLVSLAALASGSLLGLAFAPYSCRPLAWIGLIPFLALLPRMNAGQAFVGGLLLGGIFYRIGIGWLITLTGPVGGIATLIFSIWMGLSFRVARLVMDRLGARAMLWAVPLAFVGQEVIRAEGLPRLRFGFLALGYSVSADSPIAQIASLGGVYLLTGLIVLVNTALAWWMGNRNRKAFAWATGSVLLVATLTWCSQPKPAENGSVAVACVQAESESNAVFARLTREALSHPLRPRIVVLPEHSTAGAPHLDPLVRTLADLAREFAAYICIGSDLPATASADCAFDNVALLIGPDGAIVGSQAKAVPIPFFTDGNPASRHETFPTPLGRMGLYVCYDGLFTDIPRRTAALGANYFLVPVMDPERWPVQERRQHADMAPYRCIELRRSAVRAASSGISQIIDPAGRVTASRSQAERSGIITALMPVSSAKSIFSRGGWLLAPLIAWTHLALIVLLTGAGWWPRKSHDQAQAGPQTSEPA